MIRPESFRNILTVWRFLILCRIYFERVWHGLSFVLFPIRPKIPAGLQVRKFPVANETVFSAASGVVPKFSKFF